MLLNEGEHLTLYSDIFIYERASRCDTCSTSWDGKNTIRRDASAGWLSLTHVAISESKEDGVILPVLRT